MTIKEIKSLLPLTVKMLSLEHNGVRQEYHPFYNGVCQLIRITESDYIFDRLGCESFISRKSKIDKRNNYLVFTYKNDGLEIVTTYEIV